MNISMIAGKIIDVTSNIIVAIALHIPIIMHWLVIDPAYSPMNKPNTVTTLISKSETHPDSSVIVSPEPVPALDASTKIHVLLNNDFLVLGSST